MRVLGRELGLNDQLSRFIATPSPARPCHPHSGGSDFGTVRHLCAVRIAIYLEEMRKSDGLYDEIWQAFAVLLPVQAPSA